ncbi:DNA-3-methyladenine glycosylase [Adlercreutzia sp. ZJ154]|uniref:DNA-3-methyladenine glycosylase family protein n=1 Tax=Adlercreutzia sp. ZJ154 TaxID=2709790 RepID=UPI0013EA3187|nr:DNA glycosylase [Adlercreutzia sp. ZJ154]
MHKVVIQDDFSLAKIARSGQCFRVHEVDAGWWRFIAQDRVLYIRRTEQPQQYSFEKPYAAGVYEVSVPQKEWDEFWHEYFDMERNYCAIRQTCDGHSEFVDTAMRFGAGLRVLNQDPWEMLVTFIISQRKSIPAISRAVEELSKRFGRPICDTEPLFAFPTSAAIAAASDDDLKACGLGYRVSYVRSAATMVESGELDLAALADFSDEDLFAELQRVHGVGKKVANCVCLFGYGRSQMVPVDVWIERAINDECAGCDPFAQFGANAGIMQQYVFYYMTNR